MTLEAVQTFRIPRAIIDATGHALEEAGDEGYELFVLWSGTLNGDALDVCTHHVPEQCSYKTDRGLLVRVEGAALHKLNTQLFETGETLAAQVHAHPTTAFHSDTDDTYPIMTTRGGLSIVVPDFARRGVLTRGTAAYRLGTAGWAHIRRRQFSRLVEVVA